MEIEALTAWLTSQGFGIPTLVIVLMLSTFILEDIATMAAATLAASEVLPAEIALAAVLIGIVLGDLALYGFGWVGRSVPFLRRQLAMPKLRRVRRWLKNNIWTAVISARLIPGMRFPTYTGGGVFGVCLRKFAFAVSVAAMGWTLAIFGATFFAFNVFSDDMGPWRWVIAAFVIAGFFVLNHYRDRLIVKKAKA